MPASTIDYGVKLTPDSGSIIHSKLNWGCYLTATPVYSSKAPKYNTYAVPFSDVVLDFSRIDGQLHFNESTYTYELTYISNNKSNYPGDLIQKQNAISNYCWNFKGEITDDYLNGSQKLIDARCVSLEFVPDVSNGVLTISVKFQGRCN